MKWNDTRRKNELIRLDLSYEVFWITMHRLELVNMLFESSRVETNRTWMELKWSEKLFNTNV